MPSSPLKKTEKPMASSSYLVKYDKTPDQPFYLCRNCRTHIALDEAVIMNDLMANIAVFFENQVVNVQLSTERIVETKLETMIIHGEVKHVETPPRTYVEVSCLGCHTVMGKQLVDIEKEDLIAKVGRYYLSMSKLIEWDGTRMRYAHNWEPVNEQAD